jgi:hypothetical protein
MHAQDQGQDQSQDQVQLVVTTSDSPAGAVGGSATAAPQTPSQPSGSSGGSRDAPFRRSLVLTSARGSSGSGGAASFAGVYTLNAGGDEQTPAVVRGLPTWTKRGFDCDATADEASRGVDFVIYSDAKVQAGVCKAAEGDTETSTKHPLLFSLFRRVFFFVL